MTDVMPDLDYTMRPPTQLTLGSVLTDAGRGVVTAIVQLADGHVAIFTDGNPRALMEGVPEGAYAAVPGDAYVAVEKLASRPSDIVQAAVAQLIGEMEELASEEDAAEATRQAELERWTGQPHTPTEAKPAERKHVHQPLPGGVLDHRPPEPYLRRCIGNQPVPHLIPSDVTGPRWRSLCGVTRPVGTWRVPGPTDRKGTCRRCADEETKRHG